MITAIMLAFFSSCPDSVSDSLFSEVGDGSTITVAEAVKIRSAAYRVIDTSDVTCESAMRLEDLAFDMSTIIEIREASKNEQER